MRWVIVGSGAVGATIGARLVQAGADVVLVARGEHGAVLAERGLLFRAPDGTATLHPAVAAGPDDVELRADDVLLLAVKTHQSAAAVRDWALAPVAGGGTAGQRLPVVCAQNGLENERLAARWFDTVLAACVWLPATHLSPGEVVASAAPLSGLLQIGAYPAAAGAEAPDPLAVRLATELTVDHLRGEPRADALRWKRGKLVDNLVNGFDAALAGPREQWRDLVDAAYAEGRAVLAALGLEATSREEELAERGDLLTTSEVPGAGRGGSSTWQSLARGVETEVEYLNGEIARMGRAAGVPTPVNAAITRLVTAGQRAGRGPRWLDHEQLRAEVAGPGA